jgi:hypothetical protein
MEQEYTKEQEEQDLKISEARTDFDPYTILTPGLDDEQVALIESWNNEQLVEYVCDLDRTNGMSVDYFDKYDGGKHKRAWVYDFSPQVNGVRWNIQPGVNRIPRSLYESMMNTIDIARSLKPVTGKELQQISRN